MKRFGHIAGVFLLLTTLALLLVSSFLVVGHAQEPEVTLVPPLSWAELQALESLPDEVIENIYKSCCLENGEVWVTQSPYMPGGCIIDAFAPASKYWPIENCETTRFRAAVAPYITEVTPSPEATIPPSTTPEPSEGVQFTLRVEAPGYQPAETTRFTAGYDPSSIEIWGFVVDQEGAPISGATVVLVDLGESVTTDASGYYQLYVPTAGTQSFQENLDWTLAKAITGANVTVDLPDILPSSGQVPLTIAATDQVGHPLAYGTAVITVIDEDRIPYVTLEKDRSWLDENGGFSTKLILREPDTIDFVHLRDIPLSVTINVAILDKDGLNILNQVQITRPFNLALIHGTTVGPDMNPRTEEFEPDLIPYAPTTPRLVGLAKELFFGHEKNDQGDFWMLVAPLHSQTMRQPPAEVWQLKWSSFDHLPLYYPLPQPPEPGQKIELGKIDILTPEEHEERFKSVVREFIQEMPLTSNARSDALNGLNSVIFEYHSTGSVPFFKDNFTSFGGSIVTPHSREEYWGNNLVNGEDAAYVIMLHELGHFMHHTLVERHNYLHVCYNKFATGGHETWQAPTGKTETGQMYLSFAESAGDFYAYLAHKYWGKKHPEIKNSVYFKREEYLPEFETDEKAMNVLNGGTPGYKVEGVQTRFLRAYYGDRAVSSPVWVYSDYLATMLIYMDVSNSWIRRPARTIQQWVQTKQPKDAKITALASRYQLLADPVPVLMPTSTSASPSVRIGTKTVDFQDFPVEIVPFDVEIEVKGGTMNLDMSTNTQRRTLYLQQGTIIILHSDESVEVKNGIVGADFSVKIRTPKAQITPLGTMFVVRVAENGETQVQTLEGQVRVESDNDETQTLGAGEQVTVFVGGALSEVSTFDVAIVRGELSPAPEMPFDLSTLDVDDGAKKTTEPDVDPIGIGLIAALLCSVSLLFLFLLVVRVKRRRKRFPVAHPPRAASEWKSIPLEQLISTPPPAAKLIVRAGPDSGQSIPLGPTTRLGRASNNDVVLGDPQVSRHHAVITATGSGYVIADHGSANGTWVNGAQINQSCPLHHGDVINIANETLEFRTAPGKSVFEN